MRLINVPIEPLEMRYTAQWQAWFSIGFRADGWEVHTVTGHPTSQKIHTGAFLDAFNTSRYKAEQLAQIVTLLQETRSPTVVFFHDAWFPGVEALAYIRQLADYPLILAGFFHAGAYDPTDLLGRMGMSAWVRGCEESWVTLYDAMFVGSDHHRRTLAGMRGGVGLMSKIHVSGNPVSVPNIGRPWSQRENIVVFPHRLTPDKRPELLDEFSRHLPGDCRVIKTYELNLPKDEYYDLLGRAKCAVSFATHENFGIAMVEAAMLGVYPVVPDALAYRETMPAGQRYQSLVHAAHLVRDVLQNKIEPFAYPFDWSPSKIVSNISEILKSKEASLVHVASQ